MGKTNLDQFATGLVGTRSPYGRPSSALAPDRISGGSSSGSAVVVARGDVPFALGTDTAGSGRVPAGFNNIVGLKPTPGRVGTRGVVPACRSLDCVSVFALTVDDAAQVLGADRRATTRRRLQRVPRRAGAACRRRCASASRRSRSSAAMPATRAAFEAAVAQLAGARPQRRRRSTSRRCTRSPQLLYGGPWVAERHAVVAAAARRAARGVRPSGAPGDRSGARLLARPTRSAASTALREAQRELRRALAAGRPADGADRARPSAPSPRSMPTRSASTRGSASTPTSSTCSAGARWRCRPASPTAGCRSA